MKEIMPDATHSRLSLDALAQYCRVRHIRRLGLFGSVPRGDSRPDSDIDVLVEFEPSRAPGLAFWDMEDELSQMLERRADLHTPGVLSPHFRDQVLAEAEWLYVQSTQG